MADAAKSVGWTILGATSAAATIVFHVLGVPAALLLGPLLSAIVVAAKLPGLVLPRWTAVLGQAVVGCLVAAAMQGGLAPSLAARWPLFGALAASTILASGVIGYGLARMGVVPGTVAIWGSMPGGAAAMVLMAEADGADARLVAVMVYARVIVVTFAATALAASMGAGPAAAPTGQAGSIFVAGIVGISGIVASSAARWPAGTLLLTMAIGVAFGLAGIGTPRVPPSVSVVAFTLIGWRIGLTFTSDARGAALRMLPRVAAASLVLSSLCGVVALALHLAFGIDPLTAWLATSPGGLESVAIIATALPVDRPFIMAAQAARFGAVMVVGPPLATWLARRERRSSRSAIR